MGLVRLLLALSVVMVHIGYAAQPLGAYGRVAVQAFFAISGFYISMALSTSYAGATRAFWVNRALRLYPVYLVVAALTLAARGLGSDFLHQFAALPPAAQGWLAATNVALLGQDWTMFLGLHDGVLRFVTDFRDSSPPLYRFLLVPPAWSLGLELTFYALAPWLLRLRTPVLVGLAIASLGVRIALAAAGLFEDPWSYRFFPSEVSMFLVGALAYRAYAVMERGARQHRRGQIATACACVAIVLYARLPVPEPAKSIFFLSLFVLALPAIFLASKDSRIDRFIGDLSYPLYISHFLVLGVLGRWLHAATSVAQGLAMVSATIIVAIGFCLAVDAPVQGVRSKIRSRGLLHARGAAEAAAQPA